MQLDHILHNLDGDEKKIKVQLHLAKNNCQETWQKQKKEKTIIPDNNAMVHDMNTTNLKHLPWSISEKI